MLIALLILVGIVVLLVIVAIAMYNSLVRLRNRIDAAWSQIDVQLKRRYDLIPNLVETVKGYAAHERETLEGVTQARNMALDAQGPQQQAEAENVLTGALKSLFAVSEAYPDLKANQNFLNLQEELTGTEGRIAYARQYYNDQVYAYNTKIQVFPNSQLGGVGELVDGVKSGAISMGHHDFASLGKIVTDTAVFNVPFMYRDPGHAMRATDPRQSPALQKINQELIAKGNMRIVAALFQGTRQLTSKEKVLTPKDMAGKKYRGVPIKLWSSMLTGMGAVATPVEVSELATALATGLVVGQENPLPNIYNLKLYEVQKYVMLTSHMQSVLSVFINEKVYQGIPAADRKIMEDTMIEVGMKTLAWDRETVAKYRKDLEEKGMVFVEPKDGLDVEAFRKAVLAQVNKDFPEWTGYIEQIRAVK